MSNPKCPICDSSNYRSRTYAEECWGIVEEHSYCPQCGYTIEMCYSDPVVGFMPSLAKGYKNKYDNRYYPKNVQTILDLNSLAVESGKKGLIDLDKEVEED